MTVPSLPKGTKWERGTGEKKYKVRLPPSAQYPNGRTVQFGAKGYQQYKDQTPLRLYKKSDHGDAKRRDRYRKRHGALRCKNGELCIKKKYSPAWFSWHFLW